MSKASIQEMYLSHLAKEGFVARLDDDGDVVFKREGRTYLILIDEGDPEFFQLVFPSFWRIESEVERENALVACERVSARVRVAKCYFARNHVSASYEARCVPREAFKGIFARALGSLGAAAQTFREHMKAPKSSNVVGAA